MENRDFMTKENLEMIGLAVMCDRWSYLWRGYYTKNGIEVVHNPYSSASLDSLANMISLGRDITAIMEFFETLDGECKIKDVSKYLKEKGVRCSMQRITAVCRRLCASGFLKHRYSDPYKITIENFAKVWDCEFGVPKYEKVTKEIKVRDSFYSLA